MVKKLNIPLRRVLSGARGAIAEVPRTGAEEGNYFWGKRWCPQEEQGLRLLLCGNAAAGGVASPAGESCGGVGDVTVEDIHALECGMCFLPLKPPIFQLHLYPSLHIGCSVYFGFGYELMIPQPGFKNTAELHRNLQPSIQLTKTLESANGVMLCVRSAVTSSGPPAGAIHAVSPMLATASAMLWSVW
ncbi:hypothetical protein HU200_007937 [Digitaria exilis]|uniref:Uncharacterized protein n=1 Tax=Digitaria exilis TaxID=1010633 RepID=A0A835FMB7_9POAL|nr:hypothetical protein HU200_007937 [Digitaria exilis]